MLEPMRIGSWWLRVLGDADAGELQALLERCADYYRLVEGRHAGPDEASALRRALPPGRTPEDKLLLGLAGGDRVEGVVDIVRDWPEPDTWLIGLLLLDPALRGRGVGSEVVAALDRSAAAAGAARLRVAVVHANRRALRFWRSLGFREVPARAPGASALERPTARADV